MLSKGANFLGENSPSTGEFANNAQNRLETRDVELCVSSWGGSPL